MADFKLKYAASVALTIGLASLPTDANLLAGRESTAIDNSANLYLDALVSGKITTGTSPTGGKIEIWVYAGLNSTPDYPDVLDGTDSAETITSANVKYNALALAAVLSVDTTSDRTYPIKPFSVAELFGGVMPRNWGVFVTHGTGVNLNATGSNHALEYIGVHQQSV